MHQAKFESLERGLTQIARKVLAATPIAEAWTPGQIFSELRRLGLGIADVRTIHGCLNSMLQQGLVQEPERGLYTRQAIKTKAAPAPALQLVQPKSQPQEPPMNAAAKLPKTDISPMDQLTRLSAKATGIASALRELATDIDSAALSICEQIEKRDGETEKLQQLKVLLKSLG